MPEFNVAFRAGLSGWSMVVQRKNGPFAARRKAELAWRPIFVGRDNASLISHTPFETSSRWEP
jgi:hypothetical protein